jgi:hypothetical protein
MVVIFDSLKLNVLVDNFLNYKLIIYRDFKEPNKNEKSDSWE